MANSDDSTNESLPSLADDAMRQHHVYSGGRMQAFSDAIFAIMATVMVLPLKLNEHEVDQVYSGQVTVYQLLIDSYPKILMYGFIFSITLQTWFNHLRVFRIVSKADDTIIRLNLFCLLCTGFLPYTASIAVAYKAYPLAIALVCINTMIIWLTLAVILAYGLCRQRLLHSHMKSLVNQSATKFGLFLILLIIPLFCVLAIAFSFLDYRVGWAFFAPIGIISIITRLTFKLIQRCRGRPIDRETNNLLKSFADKERTEFFTDGVFSIVATLIVVNLVTEGAPSPSKHPLNETEDAIEFYQFYVRESSNMSAYFTSFIILGLLWFVHHSLFQFIQKMSGIMTLLNSSGLVFVGIIPFGSQLLENFVSFGSKADTASKDEAIRMVTAVLFLASITYVLIYCVARFNMKELLIKRKSGQTNLLMKLLVFPVISFVTYWCTFTSSHEFDRILMFNLLVWLAPVIFVGINILSSICLRMEKSLHRKTKGIAGSYGAV